MKITKKMDWVKFLVFFSIIVGTPSIVHAELEGILSNFKAHIDIQEQYDNNINLSHNNKKDDFITTVTPGLRFSTSPKSPVTGEFRQTPTAEERHGMDLDLNVGFNFYAKEHANNFISLDGTLNAWYALTQRLNFKVRDYLLRSDEVREPDYSATAIAGQYLPSRTGKRTPYIRNVFEPSMQYQFGGEDFVAINYRNNIYYIRGQAGGNSVSQAGGNSVENFINPTLTYWFDIRNGVSLKYGLDLGNFQNSPDLVGHMATGRYTYRFNPNTSIYGEYTQMWRNFDPPSIDYVVYKPSFGIQHAFSPTLSGRAQFGYFWQNPEKGSKTSGPFFDVNLSQRTEKTTYTIQFLGGNGEDLFTADNRGFMKSYSAIGTISHQLLQKVTIGLMTSYEWDDFSGSKIQGKQQIDRIWTIGGNASYQILRWLSVSLNVSYRENSSTISVLSYSDYRGIFKVTATY